MPVQPDQLIVLHKEDYEYLLSYKTIFGQTIQTYPLTRFMEEAWDNGFYYHTDPKPEGKQEYLAKPIDL